VKLLAAISHHGFGHLAQAGPVLHALHGLAPRLDLTVWSGLGTSTLRSRMPFPFRHRAEAADVGLAMFDPLRVDLVRSLAHYRDFHRDWEHRVAQEADWLRAQGFQGVFSDVAYLPLAAAARAGIPGLALCSLNWRDIAGAYLADADGMGGILQTMTDAYRSARCFLRPTPAMAMAWLDNAEAIEPIVTRAPARREDMARALGPRAKTKWVLVGFGGIGYRGRLPSVPGVTWLAPDDWPGDRPDLVPFRQLGWPYMDLLASCDALVTKVGYGSFVEAVAHGTPVLYLDRPDWPESPALTEWLHEKGVCARLAETELFSPRVAEALERLLSSPRKPPLEMHGAAEAAHRIRDRIPG
jgi:hypothetical protein